MTMAIVPNLPEREAAPASGRKQDRAAFTDAFGGEVREAEKKAKGAVDGREKKAETDDAEPKAAALDGQTSEVTEPAKDGPAGGATRDVLGLLAAATETAAAARAPASTANDRPAAASVSLPDLESAPTNNGDPSSKAGGDLPTDRNGLRLLVGAAGSTDGDVEKSLLPTGAMRTGDAVDAPGSSLPAAAETMAGRGRARLEVVHQETHFEPTMREAVLIEKGTADAAQRTPTRSEELLQMLAGGQSAPRDPSANQENGRRRDGARDERSERTIAREAERAISASPITATSMGNAPAGAAVPVALQVATRIVDAFQSALTPDRPVDHPASEAHLRLRAGGAALKTLTIQLQPEHLGTVHISMRLQEGQLTLELATSRAETARTLMEDKAGLKAILEKAGFSLEDASITVVARDIATAPSQGAAGREPDGGGRGEGRFADPQGNGREGRSQDDADRRRPGAQTAQPGGDAAPSIGRRTGSVFL